MIKKQKTKTKVKKERDIHIIYMQYYNIIHVVHNILITHTKFTTLDNSYLAQTNIIGTRGK